MMRISSLITHHNLMFILGNIVIAVAKILHVLFNMYFFVIIAAVIISWVRPAPYNDLIQSILNAVYRLTEPVFGWVRRKLPRALFTTGLDFSPLIVILAIWFLDMILYPTLMDLGISLRLSGTTPADPSQIPVY